MGRHVWDDEVKQAALLLLADGSKTFYEVRDETGVPVGTLHRWATEAGLERSDDKTEAAASRRRLRLSVKREAIAEEFLDRVEDLMGRMDLPHVVGYTKDEGPIVLPMGASADCKNYATAAAILLDKFRLEMGEHTESRRTETTTAAEQAKAKLDDLSERRNAKSA